MPFLDIHTHTYYNDPEATLVLNVFPHALKNMDHPCYKSIGLHPWHVHDNTCDDQIKIVQELSDLKEVIAIGETGLDKTIVVDYALQNKVFSAHIDIAQKSSKPLILHCVRSYSEMLGYRKKTGYKLPWIFHWFNEDITIASELIKKNCYLSFGHMLFNDHSKAYAVFTKIPPEHIFLETDDAGYSIQQIYQKAAALRNSEVPQLQKQIMDNFARCFQTL